MIRISQIKMNPNHSKKDLEQRVRKLLRLDPNTKIEYTIYKRSIDARKKNQIQYIYTVDLTLKQEEKRIKSLRDKNIQIVSKHSYQFPYSDFRFPEFRPIIIGEGPCGLFCAYLLALQGFRPLVLERGQDVDTRMQDVEQFWMEGTLNTESNVQFGEGGAGTFSDGKLNTQIKDPSGRIRFVLDTFVTFGAKEEITFESKPHIGTDCLVTIIKNMRLKILELGGEIRFQSKVTGLIHKDRQIQGVIVNETEEIRSNHIVLAIGHSARDTFEMLYQTGVTMESKSFAVGVRVEHLQETINESQYGINAPKNLPPAPYKLATRTSNGRNVYSFCMCPGGYVVNSSSEEGLLAVNGMSYSGRDGINANSAIIVSVTPEDYPDSGPLSGIAFQRELEKKAFEEGNGHIPIQMLADFRQKRKSEAFRTIQPANKGGYSYGNLWNVLPCEICDSIIEGMDNFGYNLKGFNHDDTLLSGVESRTSSPVRITRDEHYHSNYIGLYPAGEGAGYAGGITSAAVDGMRTAEKIVFSCVQKDADWS